MLSWKDEKVDRRRNLKEVSPEKEKTGSRKQLDILLSDWCAICHDGGDTLYCCDRCPKVYHMNCYVPPLPGEPADDWVCLLCTSIDEILSVIPKHSPLSFTDFLSVAANQSSEGSRQLVRKGFEALPKAPAGDVSAVARVCAIQVDSPVVKPLSTYPSQQGLR